MTWTTEPASQGVGQGAEGLALGTGRAFPAFEEGSVLEAPPDFVLSPCCLRRGTESLYLHVKQQFSK